MLRRDATRFQKAMLAWYKKNLRHYPWRLENDPYKILIAEIMLQQTNADKVEPVYTEFISKYQSINILVQSDIQDLKALLSPLGLDYRAERLKNIAEKLVIEHSGAVPGTEKSLLSLPGIGRYVSNAVLCFAYSKRVALVDVNTVRLYGRVFNFQSQKNRPRDDNKTWEFAIQMLPRVNFKEYNLALLDFSSIICLAKKPHCVRCTVSSICLYREQHVQTNGDQTR